MQAVAQPQYESETPQVASVIAAENGEAIQVRRDDGLVLFVNAHASMTPYIEEGDRVICLLVGGHSSNSAMVIDRIRRRGESPVKAFSDNDGQLTLETDQAVLLKTASSTLALTNDGKIVLSAHDIMALAKELNCIQGESVEIN